MKNILLAISVLCSFLANAQDYVVTLRNDTLRGPTKIMYYDVIDRIQVMDGKKKIQFSAIQVKAVFWDNNTYRPVRTENGYRMMKLLKPGFLSLYAGHLPNSFSYDVEYLVKRDGSSMEIPNLSFKKSMSDFLKDCSGIEDKIERLGKKNLDQIISEYNSCIDNQTKVLNGPSLVSQEDPRMVILTSLKMKLVNSTLPTKKDALDILNDITDKVKNNQSVPNYQLEGLKGLLKGAPDFQDDLDKAITLLSAK